MNTQQQQEYNDAEVVVGIISRKYKRKYWWADEQDLQQEAWTAILDAIPRWDKRFGDTAAARQRFYFKAADYSLRPAVWRSGCILYAPDKRLSELFSQRRVGDEVARVEIEEPVTPEMALMLARWQRQVRRRLAELFEEIEDGFLAEASMMTSTAPVSIAEAFAIPVDRVYAAKKRATRAVKRDATLYELWKEIL